MKCEKSLKGENLEFSERAIKKIFAVDVAHND